uniref:EP300 interacting inhibitor of differentiation 1 n=1 Tax=Pipistrellus kuhlii TaxID=59472 RepID=A0A7J7WZN0_PIPKU|nr:EP300 interacting inhibitor of differentiation 1 [Pipistrellus kuhlii]
MEVGGKLYEESKDLQMDLVAGKGDLLQMELGVGNWQPSLSHLHNSGPLQPEEEGSMEEEGAQAIAAVAKVAEAAVLAAVLAGEVVAEGRGLAGRLGPGELQVFAHPYFDDDDWAQLRGAALDKVKKLFMRKSSAGETKAVDGGFQMNYENTLLYKMVLLQVLISLRIVSLQAEELNCDEIIAKE